MPARLPDLHAALSSETSALERQSADFHSALAAAGVDGQTLEDAVDLMKQSAALHQGIDNWFSEKAFTKSRKPIVDFLTNSRHAARNVLNKIFGPIQFLETDPSCEGMADSLAAMAATADHCVQLLAGTAVPSTSKKAAPSAEDFTRASEPGLILIADDDEQNREILARLLAAEGHSLEFAADGRQALSMIRKNDYDAVLLDIQMPRLDGFGVLEELRKTGDLRHTPVIVVTGLQEESDAVRCIRIGAEDFLSRPVRQALLTARINACLEKKRLREKVFAQHFTPELAREFARHPDPTKMAGKSAEISILFCDIRRFSSISEGLTPQQTIDWLSGVMGSLTECVTDHRGVLVNYIGDELLAIWGAPQSQPDHAELASLAALDMLRRIPEISAEWEKLIGAETKVGIGINTGTAHVGNVGTAKLFKYGPLGSAVNLASRVQGATSYLRTPLLVTGQTCAALGEKKFARRRLCKVRVQNISEPVELYEIGPPGSKKWDRRKQKYESALERFEAKDFQGASELLGGLLGKFREDGPSLLLMSRAVDSMLNPSRDFDPVWKLPGK